MKFIGLIQGLPTIRIISFRLIPQLFVLLRSFYFYQCVFAQPQNRLHRQCMPPPDDPNDFIRDTNGCCKNLKVDGCLANDHALALGSYTTSAIIPTSDGVERYHYSSYNTENYISYEDNDLDSEGDWIVVVDEASGPITMLRHNSCLKQCPEDCSSNGWVVEAEGEEFPEEHISVKCDHGICRDGLVVNSTGRLKKLDNYLKQNFSIQLTGTYDFYTCNNEKAAYKNRNSSDPVFLYWSKLDKWQISKDPNGTRNWAHHTYCYKNHPNKCMNKTSERWDVKANDNDINLTNNDTDYVPDYTMTIECLDDKNDLINTNEGCIFRSACEDKRYLGELNATITAEKETKIKKTEHRSYGQYIYINHDSPLNLKCNITAILPHKKGRWHSCMWTETSHYRRKTAIHRQCKNLFSTNSTHSGIGHEVDCHRGNTTLKKELMVIEATGEYTCALRIDRNNHLFRNNWTKWTCTFTECETAECLQENGCTAKAAIGVFVQPEVTPIPPIDSSSASLSLTDNCNSGLTISFILFLSSYVYDSSMIRYLFKRT